MKINESTTLREMAFIVGTALSHAGLNAVLSGGGAASVYGGPRVAQSNDIDFVLGFYPGVVATDQCVKDLGFRMKNRMYVHEKTPFTLEFLPGELKIGNEVLTEWSTLKEVFPFPDVDTPGELTLNILTPTDCVRDRLSWFLFYRNTDFTALDQALGVVEQNEVDLDRVKRWATDQNALARYRIFEERVAQIKRL